MFLAAAPYFAHRFEGDKWIQTNYQSVILLVSTVSSLSSIILLTIIQYSANYPLRINMALWINSFVFGLLTLSTVLFLDISPRGYFTFTLMMVATTACATGLIQNGAFSFAGGFGRPEYMQAIMVGQGIAGVFPAISQVLSILMFPVTEGRQTSAFIYFFTASAISLVTVLAFIPLTQRYNQIVEMRANQQLSESFTSVEEAERATRKSVSLWTLFVKLRWLALGVMLVFTATMFFPVFTSKILSVNKGSGSAFTKPEVFIPLGFLFWNAGDLSGRLLGGLPSLLKREPRLAFFVTAVRACWVGMYLLCNINGKGAIINSDFFYLFIVQLGFGLSNGFLSSTMMVSAGDWVEGGEKEASGGFMGLCLVIGLTIGSMLSFSVSGL